MIVGFECRFENHQGLGLLEKPLLKSFPIQK